MAVSFPFAAPVGADCGGEGESDRVVRRVVLASASPRRRELLGRLGIEFDVVPADVDETPRPGERPAVLVRRLAVAKARAVAAVCPGAVVLGADTVVDLDGDILGKPRDDDHARTMLGRLSGRTHLVHTGVSCVRFGPHNRRLVDDLADERTGATMTAVTFVEMSDPMIDWYVATGEPLDKAGGYGLQGAGDTFVERVEGSVSGVLGLPMALVVALLSQLGVVVRDT